MKEREIIKTYLDEYFNILNNNKFDDIAKKSKLIFPIFTIITIVFNFVKRSTSDLIIFLIGIVLAYLMVLIAYGFAANTAKYRAEKEKLISKIYISIFNAKYDYIKKNSLNLACGYF